MGTRVCKDRFQAMRNRARRWGMEAAVESSAARSWRNLTGTDKGFCGYLWTGKGRFHLAVRFWE